MLKPKIIGICGGSCSGKTTLLRALERELGEEMVGLSFDDYYLGRKQMEELGVTDFESPLSFDYDKFIRDIKMLKEGNPIVNKAKSRESHKLGIEKREIKPKKLIFVEGFLIFHHPDAADNFDYRIYVDIPHDEITKRRLARPERLEFMNNLEYVQNKLLPSHIKYVEPQKEKTHIVLDGRRPTEELVDICIDAISSNPNTVHL